MKGGIRGLVSAVCILVFAASALAAEGVTDYSGNVGEISLSGHSDMGWYTYSWWTSGYSRSSLSIDRIAVDNFAREYCDGKWYNRWDVIAGELGTNFVQAGPKSGAFLGCVSFHAYRSQSFHSFQDGVQTASGWSDNCMAGTVCN